MTVNKILLLLVDDDDVDREMVRKSIAVLEAEVDEAVSKAEFIDRIRQNAYDLILMDYKLPDGTGIDAIKAARSLGIITPIIMITGFASDELREQGESVGLLGFCPKNEITPEVITRIMIRAWVAFGNQLETNAHSAEAINAINRLAEIQRLVKEKIKFYDMLIDMSI